MSKYFNQLSPAQLERLALLSEELGEAQQAIGKILRHGYLSTHPDSTVFNRHNLEHELGDVFAAVELLTAARDIDHENIRRHSASKLLRVGKYLHHSKVKTP